MGKITVGEKNDRGSEKTGEVDNDELREEISKKIRDCEVFLVLTKPVASRRRWLQWEIRYAKELGKPIVGIARRRNDRVSSFVKWYADDIVDTWRIDHIVNAIRIYAQEYRTANRVNSLPAAAALSQEQPDAAVEAEPSPPAPEECEGALRDTQSPREALYRDPLGSFVPGMRPSQPTRQPRWWWPFDLREDGQRSTTE